MSTTTNNSSQTFPPQIVDRIDQPTADFLKQVPLFRGLPNSQMRVIERKIESHEYEPGEIIIHEGDPNDRIFFIRYGIAKVTPAESEEDPPPIFAYLHENDIFGETGVFAEGRHHATADVTAVTAVRTLILRHDDFTRLLNDYHPAALEVARILTERLHFTSNRLIRDKQERRLYLIVGVEKDAGSTMLGSSLVTKLAQSKEGSVVYTEFPNGGNLADMYGFVKDEPYYAHDAGYDIFVPFGLPRLTPALQINLIWEKIHERYDNIVVSIPHTSIDDLNELIEHVTVAILVAKPDNWDRLQQVKEKLQSSPYLKTKEIVSVVNNQAADKTKDDLPPADFTIPFMVGLPPIVQTTRQMPDDLKQMLQSMVSRLARQNQISVYMPKYIEREDGRVDATTTMEYVLRLLKTHFGEITIQRLNEPTEEDDNLFMAMGSYVDRAALNENWETIVNKIRAAKKRNNLDEPIAVEVNHYLILV